MTSEGAAVRPPRTGARLLVDQLRLHGADRAFCVPGESYLHALDALRDERDELPLVVCRHEAAAASMAEAHGKLTGRPGVCLVTRGPGATHASVGVHTAFQDSTPLLLIVGQVPRGHLGREAFQEVDYRDVFGGLAKWVAQVDAAERIPEIVARAWRTAVSGRPGPVVLAFPEDVLAETAVCADAPPASAARPPRSAADVDRARALLAEARRPLLIVGGGAWSRRAAEDVGAFAQRSNLPVVASFRCQDYVDNGLDQYVGHLSPATDPDLARRVASADVVMALGARLGDITTRGYTLLEPPVPAQALVHAHPDPDELGRVYQPTVAINAGSEELAAALAAAPPLDGAAWGDWTAAARRDHERNRRLAPSGAALDLGEALSTLLGRLPDDAILANGAGNYTIWLHLLSRFRRFRSQLAPTSGAMGYGLPAALAAKAAHPERAVVAFAGDGCFLMSGSEMATAMRYGLDVLVIVVNNGRYGTIRMHQERQFPGRPYGTDLTNPDFAAYARAFGAHGEAVERTEDFPGALDRALGAGRAALIELRVDPDQLTPRSTVESTREAAAGR